MRRNLLRKFIVVYTVISLLSAFINFTAEENTANAAGQKVALLFGMMDYPGDTNDLKGPGNDMISMKAVLEYAGYTVYRYMDYSKADLLSTVQSMASSLSGEDTLLFAYSGHGTDLGYLVAADAELVSVDELESRLSLHSGVKEVIIDSCYSGDFISKDYQPEGAKALPSYEDFNNYVISVFSGGDNQIESKDLAQGGYYVMTACSGDQLSYEDRFALSGSSFAVNNLTESLEYPGYYILGLFNCYFHDGFGLYDNPSFAVLHADSNSDGRLTWNELYTYVAANTAGDQQAQVYPLNSDHAVYVSVTGVALSDSSISLDISETHQLEATISPSDALNKNVSWSSDSSGVATVSGGLVTAVSMGTATITVTTEDGGHTDTCEVTVYDPDVVRGVSIATPDIEIHINDTYPLSGDVSIIPGTALNKNVTYSSNNEEAATVSSEGLITGVGIGSSTITVTTEDGGYTGTCTVNVVPVAVTGVTLDKHTSEIIIGGTDTLTATIAPENATNKNITWSSDNEAVATVADGVVTSLSVGDATITVTTADGSFTDTCDVSVVPIPPDGVALNKSSTSLYVGASEILKATVSPDNAANKSVTWSSNAPGVVSVDSSGMIKAVSAGSATITVTTVDGGHTDNCSVTVSSISAVSIDDTIKVKLSIGSPTYIYFYIDGNYSVLGGSGQALERQQYRIVVDGTTLRLYLGSSSTPIHSGSTITLTQHEATSSNNFIWIDNYEHGPVGYLGNIVFSISGGTIQAVNHVYLEEYLYGVVPNEMSDSWPAEALKAQAVAARSYAASSMGGGSYDVVDTSSSQVYKGYDDGDVNTISAVDATAKKVLQYGNTIKKTYFSASNGGYTDSPYHVWPGGDNMPYAIYEDPYDVANTSSPYEKIFFPVAIDGSHPITTADNVDGTPSIANAVAYIKSRILASGQLGGGVTSVSQFNLTGVLELVPHTYDTDSGENHSINLPDGTNDCVDFVGATGRFNVSVGGGADQEVTGIELDLHYFDASNGITTYQVFNMSSLRLFVIDYEDGANPGWAIYQRRYGHGVGLSQRGAQQRASVGGQTYDYILSFYYPFASLMDLSYAKDALTSNVPVDNSNAVIDCNDYLNVREGPSTSYSIVGTLPAGARIQVITPGTWHQINYGGVSCYVHSDYVDLDGLVAVTGVSLDESSITLDKGATQTLVATISPSNATNKSVTWSTSNASVATVNSSGLVTAVGGGTATITVTTVDGGRTDTCGVTVQVSVTGVTLDESSIVIYMGKTRTLTATVAPADATDKSVTWSSDDEGIATVAGGVITPVSEGTTVIRVTTTDGGRTDFCNVTVGAPPTDAIYSSVYTVNQTDSLLTGVPDEITIADMVANLDNADSDIVVTTSTGTEITDWSAYAGTGMKVQLVDGSVVDELSVIVLGDVSGDGVINIIDYAIVKSHLNFLTTLTGSKYIAGDIHIDGNINIIDYAKLKSHLNGLISIN